MTRNYFPGMGTAVADRTINRPGENWGDVAKRVALGNVLLDRYAPMGEYENLHHHLSQASTLLSGRHLQHGDADQRSRPQTVFTNCSTAMFRFVTFQLLLSGSGVGSCYDDALMLIDWAKMPTVVCVIDKGHPGYVTREEAREIYKDHTVVEHLVADSREGWAHAIEVMERMTFEGKEDQVLLLDFSVVRPAGTPIRGMQNRPASGPAPLMQAIDNVAKLKGSTLAPWNLAMWADHYLAECVLVGGARRAARIATKYWKDATIFDFIEVKRPTAFRGKSRSEVEALRATGGYYESFMWSSNNSVSVDAEFWDRVERMRSEIVTSTFDEIDPLDLHAYRVWQLVVDCQYGDGTGEPGFLNVDKLSVNNEGVEQYLDNVYMEGADPASHTMLKTMTSLVLDHVYQHIVNPCVTGDTLVLTRFGYRPIRSLVGKDVEIWNGIEWSNVTPFSTGVNPLVRVHLSDGTSLTCTPQHKFVIQSDYRAQPIKIGASELEAGTQLAKFQMPVVEGNNTPDVDAYSQGFYSGDGNTNREFSWVYEPKLVCAERLQGEIGVLTRFGRATWKHGVMLPKEFVPLEASVAYRLGWLAGLIDADGSMLTYDQGKALQITSVDQDFLNQTRLMLTTLGVQAKVAQSHNAQVRTIKGQDFACKAVYRLLINCADLYHLVENLGLSSERFDLNQKCPQRDARRFVTVLQVENLNTVEETFCFTDPKNHTGTFNGIVTGNCGEISLHILGGFCVIADVVPFHAHSDDDAEDAFRASTRALMRVNTMDSLYRREVQRTNRIGVGMTGLHEYMWDRFGLGFRDAIAVGDVGPMAITEQSAPFWNMLSRFASAVEDEAKSYAKKLGVAVPHTMRTMKPAGTTSKLFGLTEGAHLPSMRKLLRWVQFRNDDPLIEEYRAQGYPIRKLVTYSGTTIVGFPTAPIITTLGMGDHLVTASEATVEEQFRWLQLLEHYWIGEDYGNQISYTLKYDPADTDFPLFEQLMFDHVKSVRAVSVMPKTNSVSYEYVPEQAVSDEEYDLYISQIHKTMDEDVDRVHVDCAGGACPIDWVDGKLAAG